MLAEGMLNIDHLTHPDKDLLTSEIWGSYFLCQKPSTVSRVAAAAVNFRHMSASVTSGSISSRASTPLKRVSSMKSAKEEVASVEVNPQPITPGPLRINTLWGTLIREHARMCIPDLEVLKDYPIDYRFPAFGWTKKGELVSSGFFPADPISLHAKDPALAETTSTKGRYKQRMN